MDAQRLHKPKKGKRKMNPTKLMAVALCAAACVTTTAVAEDDFGIESASPVVIADPVNPQPGTVLSGYKAPASSPKNNWYKDSVTSLPKTPAIKTIVDTSDDFSLKPLGATESNVGMWSGFLKCKQSGVYTLTLTGGKVVSEGYSLRVNGKQAIARGRGETSADVAMKVGWNKVELVCKFARNSRLNVAYKPKESLSEARPLTPAMLFHDQKPEEDW